MRLTWFSSQPGDCWKVPTPVLDDPQPFQSPINIWLDNAEYELLGLILAQPRDERQPMQDLPPPAPIEKELSRALGCQDCR
jgi:hypothetical protein